MGECGKQNVIWKKSWLWWTRQKKKTSLGGGGRKCKINWIVIEINKINLKKKLLYIYISIGLTLCLYQVALLHIINSLKYTCT